MYSFQKFSQENKNKSKQHVILWYKETTFVFSRVWAFCMNFAGNFISWDKSSTGEVNLQPPVPGVRERQRALPDSRGRLCLHQGGERDDLQTSLGYKNWRHRLIWLLEKCIYILRLKKKENSRSFPSHLQAAKFFLPAFRRGRQDSCLKQSMSIFPQALSLATRADFSIWFPSCYYRGKE